jgi:hypothetical protein
MCDHHFPGKVCLPDPAFLAPDGTGVPVISLDANNGDVFIGGPAGGFGHRGRLVITDADANPTFSVDGATGEVSQSGDIVLFDNAGHERIRITGQGAEIIIKNTAGVPVMRVGRQGDLEAGGGGQDGNVLVKNAAEATVIHLDGASGDVTLGGGGQDGDLILKNSVGNQTIHLDGNEGDIIVRRKIGGVFRQVMKFDASHGALYLGSEGNEGDLFIRNNAGQHSFQVDGNEGDIFVRREIGGTLRQVMTLDASHAALYLGSEGNEGDLIIRKNAGQDSFQVDGNEGDLFVRRDIGGTLREVMKFDASHAALYLGSEGNEGDLIVRDGAGNERIRLDGNTGDIRLQGADCAEQFDVVESEPIEPGTVLVIDGDSRLRPCSQPYDRKVAGVVSGANGYTPGIVLDDNLAPNRRLPIALNGKVYCKVDAGFSAIEVGDLLTTSPVAGHAMKATDPSQAFGSVIGKALRGLATGQGLIPVLVSLQ